MFQVHLNAAPAAAPGVFAEFPQHQAQIRRRRTPRNGDRAGWPPASPVGGFG